MGNLDKGSVVSNNNKQQSAETRESSEKTLTGLLGFDRPSTDEAQVKLNQTTKEQRRNMVEAINTQLSPEQEAYLAYGDSQATPPKVEPLTKEEYVQWCKDAYSDINCSYFEDQLGRGLEDLTGEYVNQVVGMSNGTGWMNVDKEARRAVQYAKQEGYSNLIYSITKDILTYGV